MARSDALRHLTGTMREYVHGNIPGASYLIGGQRGSGKTTLVYGAVEEVLREMDPLRFGLATPAPAVKRRPLLVRLNGPSLLPPLPEASSPAPAMLPPPKPDVTQGEVVAPPNPPQAGSPGASAAAHTPTATEHVLIEIVRSLYAAFCEEITRAFRTRAERIRDERLAIVPALWPPAASNRAQRAEAECREIAAALELELYAIPSNAWLREIWDRAGCLEHGVLFPWHDDVDQGLRELVAVSSALQTHLLISYTVKGERVRKSEDSAETQATNSATATEGLKTAIASILTGAAAGGAAGVAQSKYAVLIGALVGLASLAGFSLATRSRRASFDFQYLPDTSVASLARTLPALVKRIFDAGLAPVFVIDELDKVGHLEERMGQLVREMKQFVTERAFFCFLVGRHYYEWFSTVRREESYGPEYTFFTERVFVSYAPRDLHEYLDDVLTA